MNGKLNAGSNQHENEQIENSDRKSGFAERSEEKRAVARRNRNHDRAVMIAANLIQMGLIPTSVGQTGVIDPDLGIKFEDAVTEILLMLEAFQLDSPNGDVVVLRFTGVR